MPQLKRVLIMAGGTGGHVFPGLVMARYLREQGIEVHWLGTEQGLESRLVPEAGFPLHIISIGGLRGKGLKTLLMAPWRLAVALTQSLRIMRQVKPDRVIGMGGFVSGPGGVAAWLARRPLIIHEQNAKAGLTNKLLSLISIKILEGFPKAFNKSAKVIMTGNPVRQELMMLLPPQSRLDSERSSLRLLVLGGSLGAQALNQTVPQALARLPENQRPEVMHQTGSKHFAITQSLYERAGINANVTAFIAEMDKAYNWADVVLCRAGASTIAELCTVGLGAILVPFPHAVDDHQTANAQFMVQAGAAILVPQTQLTDSYLAELLKQFGRTPEKRLIMAQAAYSLRKNDVVGKIFEIIKEVS